MRNFSPELVEKLRKNFTANVASQFATIIMAFASIPILIANWGAGRYGEWLTLTAVQGYLTFSDLGLNVAAGNLMVQKSSNNDLASAQEIYSSAWIILLPVSILVVFGSMLVATVLPLETIFKFESTSHYELILCTTILAIQIVFSQYSNLLTTIHRMMGCYNVGVNANSVIRVSEAVATLGVAITGGSLLQAIIGSTLARVLGTAFIYFQTKRLAPAMRIRLDGATYHTSITLAKTGGAFLLFPIGLAINLQGTTLIIATLLGPSNVATFNTYRTLSRVIIQAVTALNTAIWPELTRAIGHKDLATLRQLYEMSTRLSSFLACGIGIFIAIFGSKIFLIWTKGHIEPQNLLLYLMIATAVLNALWQPGWVLLMARNAPGELALQYFIVIIGISILAVVTTPFSNLSGVASAQLVGEFALVIIMKMKSARLLSVG